MTDVRCPACKRYICSIPEGPVRAYCLKCGIKFEMTVPKVLTTARC